MKNYVNVHFKKYSKDKLEIIKKHNLDRLNFGNKIDYLLPKDKILDKNIHFRFNNFDELEQKRQNYLKDKNKKDFQKIHFLEFVISLSSDQIMDCLKNGENVDRGFINFKNEIEKEFKVDALFIDIHKDEGYIKENGEVQYNYHAHLTTTNFDLEKGLIVSSNFQRKDLSKMQDLAKRSFEKFGFERGESVHKTYKKHLKRNEFVKEIQQNELKKGFVEILKVKKELKEIYTLFNQQKNEIKILRNRYEKNSLEYNNLNLKYIELQKQEKVKREEYKNLDSEIRKIKLEKLEFEYLEKDTKDKIKEIILQNTKKETTMLGKEFFKIEDRNKFYNEILKVSNKNIKVQNIENEQQKKEIEKLKKENQNLKNELEQQKFLTKRIKDSFEIKHLENEILLKKVNKLKNRSKNISSFFKQKNIRMNDLKKYLTNQKSYIKSSFMQKSLI
ncbi:hypothetical protein [Aliarcobacter butzleri]|uniref:hypothetical protein n=1 Tax=Aliarcobacter butzleri TaxID=28197 RepID=UPI00125EA191|nr:hypothetical protein [Aliarcobacter butzleri]